MRRWFSPSRVLAVVAALYALYPHDEAAAMLQPAADAQEHSADEARQEGAPASGHQEGHVVPILIGLVAILLAATLGGELAERIGQPSVLGELLAGVVIGNLALVGFDGFAFIASNEAMAILAELGVILLLFKV